MASIVFENQPAKDVAIGTTTHLVSMVRNEAYCEHRPVRRDTILSVVTLLQKQLVMFMAAPVRGE